VYTVCVRGSVLSLAACFDPPLMISTDPPYNNYSCTGTHDTAYIFRPQSKRLSRGAPIGSHSISQFAHWWAPGAFPSLRLRTEHSVSVSSVRGGSLEVLSYRPLCARYSTFRALVCAPYTLPAQPCMFQEGRFRHHGRSGEMPQLLDDSLILYHSSRPSRCVPLPWDLEQDLSSRPDTG